MIQFIPVIFTMKDGRRLTRKVLPEDIFKEYVVDKGIRRDDLMKLLSISANVVHYSCKHYAPKYGATLKALHSKRLSMGLIGNKHGATPLSLILPKDELAQMAGLGKSILQIARHFGTSEFLVRRNLAYHQIVLTAILPARMQTIDLSMVEKLNTLVPGFLAAAKAYSSDPLAFYEKLYLLHLQISEISWWVKDQGKGYDYYRDSGQAPKSHLSWGSNRYELMLSAELLRLGIPHIRQFMVYKNSSVDFYIPCYNLCVEVDGEFHTTHSLTRRRDRMKERRIAKAGMLLLRVTTAMVLRRLDHVANLIQAYPLLK